jgi:sugar phosphate isomerase/epimerase
MMKQEFSLAHLTTLGCTPAQLVHIAARTGYDYVGLRLIPMGVAGESDFSLQNKSMVQETRAALAATGVKFLDLELARILPGCDPNEYEPAMEIAAELGARHVISSAWTQDRNDWPYLIEQYGKICDLAKTYGLTVELEFPSFSRLENLAEAVEIVSGARREKDRKSVV